MNKLQKLHLLLQEVAKDLNMNVNVTVVGNELDYDGFIYVREKREWDEHEGLVLDRLTVFYKVFKCIDPSGEMVKLVTSDYYDAAREVMHQLLDTSLSLISARLFCGEETEDDDDWNDLFEPTLPFPGQK
jgi:hypothetical protein